MERGLGRKEGRVSYQSSRTVQTYQRQKKSGNNKLLNHTGLDVVDSLIVALAISNGLIFWSGDRYILREKVINEIKEVLKKHPEYTFKYKKE